MTPKLTVLAARRCDQVTSFSGDVEDLRRHDRVDVAVLGEGPAQCPRRPQKWASSRSSICE